MCGIFGALTTKIDPACLNDTARALRHRGPDNVSFWTDSGVALLHTRLSLVDLAARSHQPFWDDTRRFVLVFNGEIYNFRELRAELISRGLEFRTSGDTEVLMSMLVQEGVEPTLERLEGMFAFGFYDTATGALTLARDRFGMKPLVYHSSPDCFVFASEVKALQPWVPIEPDLVSMVAFVSGFHGQTSGASMFKDIRLLPPGTVLTVKLNEPARLKPFAPIAGLWDPGERERLLSLRREQLVDELESRLFDGVRNQLLADAPVGVFCSGDVDSSVVAAMASELHSNLAIFHADVIGRHSERQAAETLARHLKLDLRVVSVHDSDFLDVLPRVIAHSERPITRRPDSIPFFRVCELVEQHGVKGVFVRRGKRRVFSRLSVDDAGDKRAVELGAATVTTRAAKPLQTAGAWPTRRTRATRETPGPYRSIASRFEVELQMAEHRKLRDHRGAIIGSDDLKTLDALGYHLRTLLHRNDTLGMAASIESRFPFLDTPVVRFAVNLPHEYKVRRTMAPGDLRHPFYCDKWILREVARRRLPKSLSHRPKKAFPTNTFRRMRIAPEFFRESRVGSLLGLGSVEVEFFSDHAGTDLQQRLM